MALILLAAPLRAATPTRDEFLYDVLDALHAANWAAQDEPVNRATRSVLTAYLDQNRRYDEAYQTMEKYLHDGDAVHEAVGNKIAEGALGLMNANNDLMEEIVRQAGQDGNAGPSAALLSKVAQARKNAWMSIAVGALYVSGAIIRTVQPAPASGPLPYRLSDQERQAVINRLDALFSDELTRLHAFRSGGGDVHDQTYVAYAVDKIRGYLTAETYEAAANLTKDAH